MTEHAATPELDPRFDPIFQRGYVPGAAAPAPDPTSRDSRPGREASVTGFGNAAGTPQAAMATRGDALESPHPATAEIGTAGAAMAEAGIADRRVAGVQPAGGQPAVGQLAPTGLPRSAAPDAAAADLPAADPAGSPDGGLEYAGPDAGHVGAESRFDPLVVFWIALGACVAFIVLGATLFWSQASDPSYFMGGRPGFTQTFQQFVMILSPSLVQAGVIGIAAVLVAWALRGRHDPRGREARGGR